MANNNQEEDSSAGKGYLKYSGMAVQMIAIIGLFTFGGYKIDEAAGHQTKWVTAVLSLTGVFISLYVMIRSVKS